MYRSKILWSLAGLFSTPLAAFFFIPLLLSRIDNERFGMIALAWTLLSYASALDLGIGRATTLGRLRHHRRRRWCQPPHQRGDLRRRAR